MTAATAELGVMDAVFILALVHFMDERSDHGEVVTEQAAQRIAALLSALHREPARPLSEIGVRIRRGKVRGVPEETLAQACALVLRHEAKESVRRAVALCKGKGVLEVERLEVRGGRGEGGR